MYPSRPQYGLASVPAGLTVGGVPAGYAPIPAGMSGMPAGMTALPSGAMGPGMAGVPAGMPAMYAADKSSGLYPGGSTALRLPQGSYLAQPGGAQAGYLTASQPGGYLISGPGGQQRYMTVSSQPYPSSTVGSTPSLYTGSPGYSLSTGYYTPSVTSALSVQQPTTVTESSRMTSTASPPAPTQSQYPTYIGTQLGPMQISPSQNPYAAAATGHPLYPSPLSGLQVQTQPGAMAPMTGLPGQIPGRMAPLGSATGYPSMATAYPSMATSPTIPGASYYPTY